MVFLSFLSIFQRTRTPKKQKTKQKHTKTIKKQNKHKKNNINSNTKKKKTENKKKHTHTKKTKKRKQHKQKKTLQAWRLRPPEPRLDLWDEALLLGHRIHGHALVRGSQGSRGREAVSLTDPLPGGGWWGCVFFFCICVVLDFFLSYF